MPTPANTAITPPPTTGGGIQQYNKSSANLITGAALIVLVWIVKMFNPDFDIPAEVAMAISTLIQTIAVYFIPNRP